MTDFIVITKDQNAAELFKPEIIAQTVSKMEDFVRSIKIDATTSKGRKELISLSAKVGKSKSFIDELGKSLTEESRKQIDEVNSQRNMAKERLDKLKKDTRQPVTDWEDLQKERIATYTQHNKIIIQWGDRMFLLLKTSEEIKKTIKDLEEYIIDEKWLEFEDEGIRRREESLISANSCLREVLQKEEDRKELAKLRAENDARKIKEHEDKMKKEATDKANKEAKEKADEEKRKFDIEKERLRLEKIDSEKRAEDFKKKAEQDIIDSKKREKDLEQKIIDDNKKAEQDKIISDKLAKSNQEKAVKEAQEKLKKELQESKDKLEFEASERLRIEKERQADEDLKETVRIEIQEFLVEGGCGDGNADSISSMIMDGEMPYVKLVF